MRLSTIISSSLSTYAITAVMLLTSFNSFSQQAWTRVPSPNPSASRNILSGISGTSSGDVWVVGHFQSDADAAIRNYIMHWNGADWQLFPGTDLGFNYNVLWDVAALTVNDVWAAGTYNEPGTSRSQLLHWNGSAWSHTILPAITGGSFLFSIDAIAPNDIWAVGGQAGSPTDPAYAIHYNGSGWTEFPVPSPGIYRDWFNAVDGIASNDVWAVGRQSNSYGDFHAMAQHWNGTSWTNTTIPSSVLDPLGELESVTMIASNNVWAMGSTVTGGILMIHWDGTSWSAVPTAGSAGGEIIARGTDIFSVGDRISQWNGNSWTVIDPLNQLSYPSLVSATGYSNGDIWVAGRTVDADFHSLVYRTANAIPQFVQGSLQTLNAVISSSPQNIDEMLRVQDADINQVVIYTLLTPPSHGTVTGLPDTAITNNGFATPSGTTYTPAPGYSGSDQLEIKVSVGPLITQLTINVNIGSALPVLLTNYSVSKTGATATMKWSTSSEINAKEFVMQRSSDGISFISLIQIVAQGSGYNYNLVDPLPLSGLNYYRLQQVDLDGSVTNFPIRILEFVSKEVKPVAVYPNPVPGHVLNIRLNEPGDYILSLYNPGGQQMLKKKVTNTSSLIQLILPDNILPGEYIVLLVKDKIVWSEKILVR